MKAQIVLAGLIGLAGVEWAGGAEEPARKAAPPGSEWTAIYTGADQPADMVVSSEAEWRAVWQRIFADKQTPDVDFGKNIVACVFLGTRRTGGYRVSFGEPFVRGNKLVIPYEERVPSGIVTQALTQPVAMKVFPRKSGLETILEKVSSRDQPRRD